jgi:cytochrome c oxidase cbb3-type subunit 3
MKFINYLESITGVSVYPLASLIIFTVFFTIATIWALKADKRMIDYIRHIPLEGEQEA